MNKLNPVLLLLFIALGIMCLLGFPTMFLWNWLVPSIFGLREINFLEAVGLQLLVWIFMPASKSSAVSNS